MDQTDKRQLLAELLNGNIDALRTYQNQQQVSNSPYRWSIDERVVGGGITIVFRNGSTKLISEQELEKADPKIRWIIEDHSGGERIPAPDEDDRECLKI